ncbi:uncharacterized protein LOC133136699 isoform X6 [Conger conger]|uniref:uncharacterized protein LOC133136699 isoform X6 n=1 Tax=Conger conger TaxID=82655 RepID=UPI002A5B1131|nr:uncharacterized protein LOC133136699 isoform X6 [Conger conger]
MSTSVTFQTELVAIMEVLTQAAVTEINKLVEDGYAMLRLEISRSHRENEELKRQLAIQLDTKKRTLQTSITCNVNTSNCGVQFNRDIKRQTTKVELIAPRRGDVECTTVDNRKNCDDESLYAGDNFPTVDRLLDNQTSFSLWSDGETTSVNEDQSVRRNESTGFEEGPESLLVKEETIEEDLQSIDSQRGLIISEERPVESHGGERAPTVGTPSEPAVGTEELSGQHNTRHSAWEDGRLDTVLKAEPGDEIVKLQATARILNTLGNECVLYERPGQMEMFFTQKAIESETGGPACSYVTRTDLESLSTRTQLQKIPKTTAQRSKAYRDRIKADPLRYSEQKKRERAQYLKKKERGQVKSVAELTKHEQQNQRQQWRRNQQNRRQSQKGRDAMDVYLSGNAALQSPGALEAPEDLKPALVPLLGEHTRM